MSIDTILRRLRLIKPDKNHRIRTKNYTREGAGAVVRFLEDKESILVNRCRDLGY